MKAAVLLILLALSASSARAQQCPPEYRRIKAYWMMPGMPDERGLINGVANKNLLRPGDDVLFQSMCDELCGWTVELTLRNEAMMELPITFERIDPSLFWRVHPATPLTPGTYTLNYVGTDAQGVRCDQLVYVFRVEDGPSARAPEYVAMLSAENHSLYEQGFFPCASWMPNTDVQNVGRVNSAPHGEIEVKPAEPVTDAQSAAFLYRMLPRQMLPFGFSKGWQAITSDAARYFDVNADIPKQCFVVETLQVSTLQISTSEEHCFEFKDDGTPHDPLWFNDCRMGGPTDYGRTWCETNRAACSASSPRASNARVQAVCATYAEICAPVLGKRAQEEGACR